MAAKTFVVERQLSSGAIEKLEIKADRAEQEAGSTRVTFYSGQGDKSSPVASFINIQGWYEQP